MVQGTQGEAWAQPGLTAVWLWASHSHSFCLSFLIYKMKKKKRLIYLENLKQLPWLIWKNAGVMAVVLL